MRFKIAVYRVQTSTIKVEADNLEAAIAKVFANGGDENIRVQGWNSTLGMWCEGGNSWSEESFYVDNITTAALQGITVESRAATKSRWIMPGDAKPKKSWSTSSTARVDEADTGKAQDVRPYEPRVTPMPIARRPGRPRKVVIQNASATIVPLIDKTERATLVELAKKGEEDCGIGSSCDDANVIEAHAKRLHKSVQDITRAIKEASDAFNVPFDDMAKTTDWVGLL